MESGTAQNSSRGKKSGPVWTSARELGSGGPGLASIGQGPVAILAGFDLTTVVLLATGSDHGVDVQAAIACFGLAAALFILAMAFITAAEDYSATPGERMMYNPEAQVSAKALDEQRRLQSQDENLLSIYYNFRVIPSVTLAVLGTLAGLALVAVDKGWYPGTDIAAAAAVVVGLIYIVDVLQGGRDWWLFPRPVFQVKGKKGQSPIIAVTTRVWPAWKARRERRASIVETANLHVPRMNKDGLRAMLGQEASAFHDGREDTATPAASEESRGSSATTEDDVHP
jgi:hypothetical protein